MYDDPLGYDPGAGPGMIPGSTRPRDGLTQLKGTVEHIIYANEENGYTVLDFGMEDDVITACGLVILSVS